MHEHQLCKVKVSYTLSYRICRKTWVTVTIFSYKVHDVQLRPREKTPDEKGAEVSEVALYHHRYSVGLPRVVTAIG